MSKIPEQQTREEIMSVFRDALYAYGDMYTLSKFTGLSRGCLEKIRSGKTMWPRWNTLETLMIPLRIRMHVKQYK